MKKLTLLTAAVLALLLAIPAGADVLWTPDNDFFETHYESCEYLGRAFYANSPEGYVTLWDAPGGSMVAAQYENGAYLWVYWLYEDWGCISVWGEEERVDGWVPMADLALIYDHISFAEEYAGQIAPYNNEFAGYAGEDAEFRFYEYPGAPSVKTVLDTVRWPDALTELTREDGAISSVFVDENGLTWGYVAYLFGRMNAWFCLDHPGGSDFPIRQVGDIMLNPAKAPDRQTASAQPSPGQEEAPSPDSVPLVGVDEVYPAQTPKPPASLTIPYILVGCVVAVTAVLLVWLAVKKKKETQPK